MKKIFILFCALTAFSAASAQPETEAEYKKIEQLAYEHAKKHKDDKDDRAHREYLRVVMHSYKQTWADHHPVLTAVLVVSAVLGVLIVIGACLPDPPAPGNGAQPASPRRNGNPDNNGDGGQLPGEQPIGRNPALAGDGRYAGLNPRPEGYEPPPAYAPPSAPEADPLVAAVVRGARAAAGDEE